MVDTTEMPATAPLERLARSLRLMKAAEVDVGAVLIVSEVEGVEGVSGVDERIVQAVKDVKEVIAGDLQGGLEVVGVEVEIDFEEEVRDEVVKDLEEDVDEALKLASLPSPPAINTPATPSSPLNIAALTSPLGHPPLAHASSAQHPRNVGCVSAHL